MKISPLQTGIVRIQSFDNIGSEGGYSSDVIITYGQDDDAPILKINASRIPKAEELLVQLASLGIKEIDPTTIVKIAKSNGNNTFEGKELKKLDAYLESRLSDQEIVIKDRKTALAAVKRNWLALRNIAAVLKKDKEIVMTAVRQCGWALKDADEILKKDKEIVLAAVKQKAEAIQFAVESLRNDREVVLAAVNQEGIALKYVAAAFMDDREIMSSAIKNMAFSDYSELLACSPKFSSLYKTELDKIHQDLTALNIAFPNRFNRLENVKEIIANRKNLSSPDPRPLAVLIYTKSDRYNVFEYECAKRSSAYTVG